jgi:hypothetical protein
MKVPFPDDLREATSLAALRSPAQALAAAAAPARGSRRARAASPPPFRRAATMVRPLRRSTAHATRTLHFFSARALTHLDDCIARTQALEMTWGWEAMSANVKDGYVEGLLRGYRGGLLTAADYNNLCQCENLDDIKLHLVRARRCGPCALRARGRAWRVDGMREAARCGERARRAVAEGARGARAAAWPLARARRGVDAAAL